MTLLIIDLGGQYCHLIKRRLGDNAIIADIRDHTVSAEEARHYKGIILSGGPLSVYEEDSPTIDPALLDLGIPILGICYGHQLLAHLLGGSVVKQKPEYGSTAITVVAVEPLLLGTPSSQIVWMSHGDSVIQMPDEIIVSSISLDCPVCSWHHRDKPLYGVQFHPEVVHTEHGPTLLENFSRICGVNSGVQTDQVEQIISNIQEIAADKAVFFFVSGGVDSTVAFALCARALPRDKLLAVYVNTGFMRRNELDDIHDCFDRLGMLDRLIVRDWSKQFMAALDGVVDPEQKRQISGDVFVQVQQSLMAEHVDENWLLGQGTIYPDIIESGGDGGTTATIKTHHNRCPAVQELIRQGRVIEPLRDLYKDQVRAVGLQIGIPALFVERWPFPGPGLAIRCLCATETAPVETITDWDVYDGLTGLYDCVRIPLRSVGVQGDARTYRTTMAVKGPLLKSDLTALARQFHSDRIIAHLAGEFDLHSGQIFSATLTETRIAILREADYIVRSAMVGHEKLVWQFPVVMLPLGFSHAINPKRRGETIVLRPVTSRDGMTADFVIPPKAVLERIVGAIMAIPQIDAVFLDVSDKPPATIEWE